MEVFPSVEDLRIWADRLEEVQDRLAPYFERAEPRHRAMASIRGEVERDREEKRVAIGRIGGRIHARWDATFAEYSALGCRSSTR